MSVNEAPLPRSCIYTAKSVSEFLDYLLPSSPHWQSARRGDMAYRGQASSRWRLIPKAFREDQLLGYHRGAQLAKPTRVEPQAQAEFRSVHQFVRAADNCGLQITETGSRLLIGSTVGRMTKYWKRLVWLNIMACQHAYSTLRKILL